MATPTYLADLRAFCLVAELGTISAAARVLGESAGSVSKRISRLEREIGQTLIRRSTRAIVLTEDGARFLEPAKQALELLDMAASEAAQAPGEPAGTLRLSSSPGFALTELPRLIAEFSAKHPGVRVELFITDEAPNFSTHRIDAAFLPSVGQLRDSALIAREVRQWTNVFAASPAYLERAPRIETPDDLEKHRVILGGGLSKGEIWIDIEGAGEKRRMPLSGATISHDINFARACCVEGGGIGFIPSLVIAGDLKAGRLVRVLADYQSDSFAGSLYLLRPMLRRPPAHLSAFLDFLAAWETRES